MSKAQTDRVLAALVNAGPRGICAVDFSLPNVVDGGPPITRVAARIGELEARGCQIVRLGWRSKCRVYGLVSVVPGTAVTAVEPGRVVAEHPVAGSAAVPEPTPTTLFDAPVAPARQAIFDDWEAA